MFQCSVFIWLYLSWSMLWVRWWRDRGLIWYRRTWHVLGWSLGVTYACRVPYCPSMDLTYKTTTVIKCEMHYFFYDASSWALLYMWYQASITDNKNYSFQWNNMLCNKMQHPVFEASVTLSSSLVVLAWHLYVANRKFPLGCWKRNKESHTLYCRVEISGLSKEESSPLNHIHWNWQQPSSYPRPADLWGHHSAHKSLFRYIFSDSVITNSIPQIF